MKTILIATLLIFSMAAVAGGGTNHFGMSTDEPIWFGDSYDNADERTLGIRCPEGTSADSIEAETEEAAIVLKVVCNYTN